MRAARTPRRAVTLLAVALSASGLVAAPASASPIPPEPELWLVDADGTDPVLLAQGVSNDFDWAPQGDRIAYSLFGDIYVANADGTSSVNITSTPHFHEMDPAWSPDGTQIAFSGLGIVAADGSGYRLLADPSGARITGTGPDWSPDGSRLSFVQGPGEGVPAHVHTVAIDGSDVTKLSETDAWYTETSWSPDGQWIAFDGWGGGPRVVAADGSEELAPAAGLTGVGDYDWSPDGTKLLLAGSEGVFVFDVATRERSKVIDMRVSSAAWSPDMARIAFTAGDIYVADADGASALPVLETALRNEFGIDWAPMGERLAFIALEEPVYCRVPGERWPVEATIVGTDGDDVLEGTHESDVIAGQGGDDVIRGVEGNDVICGGSGDDAIDGGGGSDAINGGSGSDEVAGSAADDVVAGKAGSDRVDGGDGNDRINGNGGLDLLAGGTDGDALEGGRGSDILRGGPGDDSLDGDARREAGGLDSLHGGRGHDHCGRGESYWGCELTAAERNRMRRPPPTVLRGGGARQRGVITHSYCWSYRDRDPRFSIAFCTAMAPRESPRPAEKARAGARGFVRFRTSERPDELKLVLKPRVDENGYPAGPGPSVAYRWRRNTRSDGSVSSWDAVFRLPGRRGHVYPIARAKWSAHGSIMYDWHLRLR